MRLPFSLPFLQKNDGHRRRSPRVVVRRRPSMKDCMLIDSFHTAVSTDTSFTLYELPPLLGYSYCEGEEYAQLILWVQLLLGKEREPSSYERQRMVSAIRVCLIAKREAQCVRKGGEYANEWLRTPHPQLSGELLRSMHFCAAARFEKNSMLSLSDLSCLAPHPQDAAYFLV